MKGKSFKDLFEELAKKDNKYLIWFLLGSLISADTLINVESCEKSIEMLNDIANSIDDLSDLYYSKEEREEIKKYCLNGLNICNRDLENFKMENKNENSI